MSLDSPVILPDTLERLDLSYSSGVWQNALPSYVFIIPFIGKHEGFALLSEVTKDASRDVKHVVKHIHTRVQSLLVVVERAEAIPMQLRNIIGLSLISQYENATDGDQKAREEVHRTTTRLNNANKYLLQLKARRRVAVEYHNRAIDLWEHLDVLHKILYALNTIQKKFGAEYAANPLAVRKLTVCMKCLDCAWDNMRYAYKTMKIAEGAMARNTYVFPFEEFADLFENAIVSLDG